MSGPPTLLLEQIRRALVKPPANAWGNNLSARRSAHPSHYRETIRLIDGVTHYVLGEDFIEAAAMFAEQPPEILLRAARFVRLPFDAMWFEWNDVARRPHTQEYDSYGARDRDDLPTRKGILLQTMQAERNLVIVHLQPVLEIGGIPLITTAGFELYLHDDAIEYGHSMRQAALSSSKDFPGDQQANLQAVLRSRLDEPMGWHYVRKQHPGAAATELSQLSTIVSNCLYGDPGEMFLANDAQVFNHMDIELALSNGDARLALAVLTLLSDSPKMTLRYQPGGGGGSTLIGGKFLPKYTYEVVSITRPAPVRVVELSNAVKQHVPWSGVREHMVEGHWCFSHRHGRVGCEHSDWDRVRNADGKVVGLDMWRCHGCGQFRWWRRPHKRGNPELGVIERGYEVSTGVPPAWGE